MADLSPTTRWPVLFVGHGTPLNAMLDNRYTQTWEALGRSAGRPAGILCVSAHWYTRGTGVTAMPQPRTLYDFGYTNMYHIKYPAPGDPALAAHVARLLEPADVVLDESSWGFDHGAWSIFVKMFPAADIPVVQLSVNAELSGAGHFELGRRLAPLRDENILIVCSGNIVHNLQLTIRQGPAQPYPWAERFDGIVRDRLEQRDWQALVDYGSLDDSAALAVPTPDHYLPLIYALGAADPAEQLSFPVDGVDRGSMSMRTVLFGEWPRVSS